MFCFPSPSHRKERGKSKPCDGFKSDFSRSVSSLNHLSLHKNSQAVGSMSHSESNITAAITFWKSVSDTKSPLIRPSENGIKIEAKFDSVSKSCQSIGDVTESAFDIPVEINFIDDAEILSYPASITTFGCRPIISVTDAVSSQEELLLPNDRVPTVCGDMRDISINDLSELNAIGIENSKITNCAKIVPKLFIANKMLDCEPPLSGSASSEGIAPIASPEPLSPPESRVSSPMGCSNEFIPDLYQFCSSPSCRYKLLREGDIQVCYLNHTRTIVSKVLSSKFLRRWENHHVFLGDSSIFSRTAVGYLESPVQYTSLQEVYVVHRWEHSNRFCIRLVIPDGSILLQAQNSFLRDQWFHSIHWVKNMHKYSGILKESSRPEVILKEIKNLVEFAVNSPVYDESVLSVPISIISRLLSNEDIWRDRSLCDQVITTIAPLLQNTSPTSELCVFFSEHCQNHPRSPVVAQVFKWIIHRILKRNVDFSKSPMMRRFVAGFIKALQSQNNGQDAVCNFVKGIHGEGSCCPHPRVLPNLVAASLGALFEHFEDIKAQQDNTTKSTSQRSLDKQHECFLTVLVAISEFEDWRQGLAQLLQPVPLPDEALLDSKLIPTIRNIGTDKRCAVHSLVLGVRPGKEGWFHIYCPSSPICSDGGVLWCQMLETLIQCCCGRKSFLLDLVKYFGAVSLMALRDHAVAQDILCLMLEWRMLAHNDQELQVVTTLESTVQGKEKYQQLCKRQEHLRELQQKGGPRKLKLPSRCTDTDLARLLSSGCFGNLECLSLAFTHVTSACAKHLIQLPSLRSLNLWSTQFGDAGLLIIAEHLDHLQVLNLCETPVSDKGISALTSMSRLKKLNLNSTKLSSAMLEVLKERLPELQELDVRYTDAW